MTISTRLNPAFTRVFAAALLLLPASAALSQAACKLPTRIDMLEIERPQITQPNRLPVDSYLLALSWSPNYCSTARNKPDARHQCEQNDFGWVVHGLWPNSTKAKRGNDQPAYCRAATGISEQTYRQYLCLVPGVKLMSHEWSKHGTCGFTTPENYFAKTAQLHAALKLPDPQALARTSKPFTAGSLRSAFANANPGLPLRAITVDVDRKQRLREVRVCYDSRYRYTSCARPGAPDRLAIGVTPVRD
jgi:ribonuclease T2